MRWSSSFHVGRRAVGRGEPVYVIAEAGVAHFGDPDKAMRLVDLAADAGADAVKFQMFSTKAMICSASAEWRERMAPKELPPEVFADIRAYCAERGIVFLCTAHDEPSLEALAVLDPPAYKIGSGELRNWKFIEAVAALGKPVFWSTGMYNAEEVAKGLECFAKAGNPDVAVLHCVTSYPTPPEQVNLRAVPWLAREFGVVAGYSDHTVGEHFPLAAAALGAKVLEKHISLDFNVPNAQDWKVSLDGQGLKGMIERLREIESGLGIGDKRPARSEEASVDWARKSLVTRVAVPAGTTLRREHLVCKRPGYGIPPDQEDLVVGRVASRDIPEDTLIRLEMFS
ncbi:N-acetylneuraminate synthase family protein [Pseudodesulfovibrio karagichevae]|uniref:N-acetylneuraminate synthase family protein n=1 Tax=Pseudodesulfovibrio karagichevae TaxID=3239305 RepID=A0ABV4K571_9BACT